MERLIGLKSSRAKEDVLSQFSFHDPVDRYSSIDSSVSEKYKWKEYKNTKNDQPNA
jgi:hypothetical protein